MKALRYSEFTFFSFCCFFFIAVSGQDQTDNPIYLDIGQSIEKRVEDLLGRMTLAEKIGQMNMPCAYKKELGVDIEGKAEGARKFVEGTFEEGIGPGGGLFAYAHEILHDGPMQQAIFFNELQKIAIEKTRLKIPLLQIEEGTHGLMCTGGTVFPEGLAIGSTWDMELIKKIYATTASEARALGIHLLFTFVIEPIRDPRMGRNEEGYSEDPFLCSRIAKQIVQGAQGSDISLPDKVIAGLTAFPGQTQPLGGLERGSMDISERVLREVFLPPWKAGIKEAGALGVMATYPSIDGVPVHASNKLLTGILRQELEFEGVVFSEGGGISTLLYEKVAASQKEAGIMAINAGVDVGISLESAYMEDLIGNVKEGKVNIETINRSVRRILEMKFRLGLFENPFVDPEKGVKVSHTKENQELALQASREGIVLLKNEENLLPLKKNIKSIAVIGPNADHERNQLGDYTTSIISQDVVTVIEGIRKKVSSQTKVNYVKGCHAFETDLNEISKARKAAKNADVAIVVVGENDRYEPGIGANGEGADVASLDLAGLQKNLIKAVYQTGTPTVVVLINGRPLSTRWTAENVPAIVEAWRCGEQGGNAIADVLFGDYNPSGKLPITIPRHVGQLPIYYNYYPSKDWWINIGWSKSYIDIPATPLFEFGFGLSYTTFEYSNLQILPESIGSAGNVSVSINVKNTGNREGSEVVQLYINDVISSIVTPIKELKGFEKISLHPGEKKSVRFTLTPADLSFTDENMKPKVEPGTFNVMVGSSCEDIKLRGSFEITN